MSGPPDVLVVGAGPSGLTLAIELALRYVACRRYTTIFVAGERS